MRQAQLISIAAVAVLGLAGCDSLRGGGSGGQDDGDDVDVTVQVEGDEVAEGEIEGEVNPDGTSADGESTEVGNLSSDPNAEGDAPVGAVPLDLITSTNPNTRAQQVQRDRPDPFGLLPATPTVEIPVAAAPAERARPQTSGSAAGSTPGGSGSSTQARAGSGASGSSSSGSSSATRSSSAASGSGSASDDSGSASAAPAIPLPPPTTIARAVEVSGVVQIGSVPYAIVRAPNEPTSRYVRAGQSLSNGTVLVKRIDSSPGLEPVVVLEQNGVEVVRNIDGGSVPSDDTTETASTADASLS